MEEIFEIRSCIEILANDIKVNTADEWVYALQLTENCKVYILEDLHPLGGKNVLNMYDLFEDDYNEFVLGELTEWSYFNRKSYLPYQTTQYPMTSSDSNGKIYRILVSFNTSIFHESIMT